jgi:enoyl-CoA hydratase/carnithine racemase
VTATLTVEELDDRVVVTLRRPEARNAIDTATDDLAQAILFESTDQRARMDAFLAGDRS